MQSKTFRGKGSSFAAMVTSVHSPEEKTDINNTKKQDILYCHCCSRAHFFEKCQQFQRKERRGKIRFLKEKETSFGCLRVGHVSRECDKRLICEVCDRQHPTALHITKVDAVPEQTGQPPEGGPSTTSQTCGHTGSGKDRSILSIMPVQVTPKEMKSFRHMHF